MLILMEKQIGGLLPSLAIAWQHLKYLKLLLKDYLLA